MLKILISNDDGYDSPGLEILVENLKGVAELFVVAPEINNSGAGCSITTNRPLKVIRHDNGFVSVNGKPADCVHLGIHELTPWKPDLVISGINLGANMGEDLLYSGTVGAAVGGRNLKYPPIAISVASYDAKDIDFISNKSSEIIDRIVKSENTFKGKVININFPDIAEDEYKGIKATGISRRDIPSRPIKLETESTKTNTYKYRYNLSGEPIKENSFVSINTKN